VRAAVLRGFGDPVAVESRPEPEPRDGEVVVRVERAGVCGTDVKLWKGLLPDTPLPLVPGHENAGTVAAVGHGVVGLSEGDRVVTFHHLFCGHCDRCVAGRENLCRNLAGRIGFDHDGGWAEYVAAPARNVLPLPDSIPLDVACVVPDAVATTWRAVHRIARVRPGESVIVVGAGGLGLSACQIAASVGADVMAVDVSEEKLVSARALGVRGVVAGEAIEAAHALPHGGADAVLDCAGAPAALDLAPRLLVSGGRLVQVGYTPGTPLAALSNDVALRELEIRGCRGAGCRRGRDRHAARRGHARPRGRLRSARPASVRHRVGPPGARNPLREEPRWPLHTSAPSS
jgi:D-arabinose 1-dehydrogenase-like Zn-dependent alcohol dehydrogenase